MHRSVVVLLSSAAFGLAACGTGTTAASTGANANTAASLATTPTATSAAEAMTSGWSVAQADVKTVGNDAGEIGRDAGAMNMTALDTDCSNLISDAQKALSVPAAPDARVAEHLQAALTDYAKAGSECQNGIASDDVSQIEQASTDIVSGTSEISQATSAINSISGDS